MPIPSPGIPSATSAISSVELQTTLNNRAFYIYSGEINVTSVETTMISINDIGKRDILFCFYVGMSEFDSDNPTVKVYNNGIVVYRTFADSVHHANMTGNNEAKLIIPANTSLELSIRLSAGDQDMNIAGYGYYLD